MEILERFFREVIHINTAVYEVPVIIFFTIGSISWIYTYWHTTVNIKKFSLVEIPILVAPLNLAWEMSWGFWIPNDYGPIFKYASIAWFFLDCFINYKLLYFGKRLVTKSIIEEHYFKIWFFLFICGLLITNTLVTSKIDNGIGIGSAYLINVLISSSYLYQLINFPEYRNKGFSINIAWGKFLGTTPVSIGCFLHTAYLKNHYVLAMCVIVTFLDILYIYLFYNYIPKPDKPINYNLS